MNEPQQAQQAPHDPTRPPEPLTPEEYEGVRLALIANVSGDKYNPLVDLDEKTHDDLRRLAFTDGLKLDQLELSIQAEIATLHKNDARANKFKLASYRKGAKEWQRSIAQAIARRQKMAARNMKLIEGTKADTQLGAIPDETPTGAAADMYSSSPYLQSVGLITSTWKGRIWYDEFHNNFFSDWSGEHDDDRVLASAKCDDAFLRRVHTSLLRQDTRLAKSSYSNSERATYYVGAQDIRNEPRGWLEGLAWDGVDRLPTWLHHVYGAPKDQYHADVGRCWIVSMVARIMKAGEKVDTMPVLIGPQGNKKSTSLAVLGGPWYATLNVSAAKETDFLMTLAGVLVAEIAELDALFNKRTENSRVKSLLSTYEDTYRPPYGRTTGKFKRTAVMVGTTNDMDWHRDDTGGRRFWPIMCDFDIDVDWLRRNREQLFAEALVRYRRGEAWHDVDRVEQERRLEEHKTEDGWLGAVEAWLQTAHVYTGPGSKVQPLEGDAREHEEVKHWGTVLTTNRVAMILGVAIERVTPTVTKRVAVTLRALGWKTTTVRCKSGRIVRGWIKAERNTYDVLQERHSDQLSLQYQGTEHRSPSVTGVTGEEGLGVTAKDQ